jgi:hypothetical protein
VLRDHTLFVCGDDIDTNAAGLRTDPDLSSAVGALVEHETQPGTARAEVRPYCGRMLADAGREYEAIKAAQGSRERADLARGPEYE